MSHWRTKSRRAIVAAMKEAQDMGLEGKALEKHVSAAYPFGARECHPYKIWLSEFGLLVKGKPKKVVQAPEPETPLFSDAS